MKHFYKKLNLSQKNKEEFFSMIKSIHHDFVTKEKISNSLIFYSMEDEPHKNYYNIDQNHYISTSSTFENIISNHTTRKDFFEKYKLLNYFSNSFLHNFRYHRHIYAMENIIYPYILAVVNASGSFEMAKSVNHNDPLYSPRHALKHLNHCYQILDDTISTELLVQDFTKNEGFYLFHSWYWHTWKTQNINCMATTFIPNITDCIEFEEYIKFLEESQ